MVPFCLLRACDSYHPLGCMHAHRLNSRERLVLNSLGCYHSVSRPPPPVLDHIKLHCIALHHIVLELLPCYLHLQMHLHLNTYLNLHRSGRHLSFILIATVGLIVSSLLALLVSAGVIVAGAISCSAFVGPHGLLARSDLVLHLPSADVGVLDVIESQVELFRSHETVVSFLLI